MSSRTLRTKLRRDVRRQWPQFAAVAVTVMLGVALFGASYDAYANLAASYDDVRDRLTVADLWITGGDTAAVAAAARQLDGAGTVVTRVQADLPLRIGPDKLRGRVIGIPVGEQPALNQLAVLSGHYPAAPDEVLVEQHEADHAGLAAGDTVSVHGPEGWHELTVSGVAASGEYLWPARSRQEVITLPEDFGVLFVPAATAETLAGHGPNQVTVRLAPGADPGALAPLRDRASTLGATTIYDWAEQPSNSVLQEDVSGFRELAVAFPALFLTAAALATYVLLSRRVRSERQLIGTMLASGLSRREVRRHYVGYGLAAGVAGAVPGVVLGALAARGMTRFYTGFIDLPFAITDVRVTTILIGLAFGVVTGVVAALGPARAAMRTPPAEAMRGVIPVTGGRLSLVERWIPWARRLPARWRMPLRNIGRNRRRSAYTVLGVMLSLLLILTAWGMLDTMQALLRVQFEQVQQEDARVQLATPGGLPAALAAVDGVSAVEPVTELPVALRSGDASYGTLLRILPADTALHGFVTPGGDTTRLPDDGILAGQALHDQIGVEAGDTIVLDGGPGARVEVTLAGFVDEPLGTFAYASYDVVGRQVGQVPVTGALLRFTDGADRDAVRRAVTDLDVVASYEDAKAFERLFDDFTGLFDAFVGAMLVLGGLMAFAILFATMSVNIVERSREVATLRAAGVGRRAIGWMITTENLLVTLLGVVPGLVLGLVGARAMLQSYSNDQFTLDLVVSARTLVISSAAIVLVAGLSQIPGIRAIRRLDIAQVVRERSA